MIESLHFVRPWWLLALLGLPLLGMLLNRRAQGGGAWQQFVDPELLPYVLEQGPAAGARWGLWLGLPAAALAILALAGPAWERLPQPVFHGQAPLIIALDLSRSMDAADVAPSRAARARLKVLDILQQRSDGQTALVAFAGDAFVVSPLTDDAATIASMVPSLEPSIMPAQGSNIAAALDTAADLLDQAGAVRGDVLLLTDSPAEPESLQAARRLSRVGHRLSVLAIGTREGAPVMLGEGRMLRDRNGNIVVSSIDSEALAALAMAGGGAFSGLTVDDTDLSRLLPDTVNLSGATQAEGDIRTDQWREEGPWLLLPLLPLAALLFRRGVMVCLVFFLVPWPAHAGQLADAWASLWLRPDQRGAQLFEADAPAAAAATFEDPEWRAAAAFRAGDFEASAAALEGMDTARAHYNRGNALAAAQDIAGAIAAYERALELDPGHEDARYNLEQLLQQQEQQQQQQGESGDESQQDSDADSEQQRDGESGDAGQQSDEAGDQQPQPSSEDQQGEDAQNADASQNGGEQEDGQAGEQQEADSESADEDGDGESEDEREARAAAAAADELEDEERQSAELWLRRIPDDPGGLLRRKLLYQHRQRDNRGETEEEPW